MGEALESVRIAATLKDVWDLYFDPSRWPSWVDGFAELDSASGYPEVGGTLRWRTNPAGRGEVTERVLEHEPRTRHLISFSDPESEGELETVFEIEGDGVAVTQRMSYKVLHPGPLGPLTDIFFVRRQVAASLARSLEHLRSEVEPN
jgi:uncharacterized protein YndB with AHSA1/START domain